MKLLFSCSLVAVALGSLGSCVQKPRNSIDSNGDSISVDIERDRAGLSCNYHVVCQYYETDSTSAHPVIMTRTGEFDTPESGKCSNVFHRLSELKSSVKLVNSDQSFIMTSRNLDDLNPRVELRYHVAISDETNSYKVDMYSDNVAWYVTREDENVRKAAVDYSSAMTAIHELGIDELRRQYCRK